MTTTTKLRAGDDPAQADQFLAMRSANQQRRAADAAANPVTGASNYEEPQHHVNRLLAQVLGLYPRRTV